MSGFYAVAAMTCCAALAVPVFCEAQAGKALTSRDAQRWQARSHTAWWWAAGVTSGQVVFAVFILAATR